MFIFSHCVKITDKSNLRKEGLSLTHGFMGYNPLWQERHENKNVVQLVTLCPQSGSRREKCLSLLPRVVLVIQPGTPALGVLRPAVRVGGFSSVKPEGLDPIPPLSHYHLPVSPLGTTKLSIVNVHLTSLIKCT